MALNTLEGLNEIFDWSFSRAVNMWAVVSTTSFSRKCAMFIKIFGKARNFVFAYNENVHEWLFADGGFSFIFSINKIFGSHRLGFLCHIITLNLPLRGTGIHVFYQKCISILLILVWVVPCMRSFYIPHCQRAALKGLVWPPTMSTFRIFW